ncbi:MAG: c-type cytochrome [Campylobacterota bacterium]
MNKTITIAVTAAFLLLGCDSKETTQEVEKEVQQQVKEVKKTVEEKSQEVKQNAKEVEKEVLEPAKEKIEQEMIDESEAPIEQDAVEPGQTPPPPPSNGLQSSEKSAQELYVSCIACHGAKAEKKALGASEVIAGWDVEKTVKALKGYKDGSYGGKMKASMTGQVRNLSDADIQKLAQHINSM